MRNYKVSFWYYTDLRLQKVVEASGSVEAIVLAMEEARRTAMFMAKTIASKADWCDEDGFRIEVQAV